MSQFLQLLANGSLQKEYPKIAAGRHVFAISTYEFTKQKNKLGVIGEIARCNLVTLESTAHKPGTKLNHEWWFGFPDRDFVGQQDRKVSEMLTFATRVLGLSSLEDAQKALAGLRGADLTKDAESYRLFGIRVACNATAGVSKKGKAFVDCSWEHVEDQTPEVIKSQADELAAFLGIALPSATPTSAPATGLLGSLAK